MRDPERGASEDVETFAGTGVLSLGIPLEGSGVCCSIKSAAPLPNSCYWATDEMTCSFGTAGQARDLGFACDGASGNCVLAPGEPGAWGRMGRVPNGPDAIALRHAGCTPTPACDVESP